ncbi:MAG: DUF3565 domain-containing protein [Deltaproteobacteria bacterium]|nr:DUF3565 domain-containing protein [Deltaproteobacteria bacterium]
MQRPIIGFHTDRAGDWVAELDCGHGQHVRHTPPFMERPWVTSAGGRESRIGQSLDCVRCDAAELPEHFVAYRRTAELTADTLPDGLRRGHSTRAGVWAKIQVREGRVRYCVDERGTAEELSPGVDGVVVPQVVHHLELLGPVRLQVEFYRDPAR